MNTAVWSKSISELKSLRFLGRLDAAHPAASLRWPLSGMEMMLRCSCLSLEAEATVTDQAPWITLFVDGALICRFPAMPGRHRYPLLQGMDPAIPHKITLCNDTQPMENNPMSLHFLSLQSDGELLSLPPARYHLEFIGDSLTTGEGCIGPEAGSEWKSIWMCPSLGYAQRVGQAMDAQISLISQSGWGVYCSWDNNPNNRLPRIYDQLCGVIPEGQVFYQKKEAFDAIIIHLGTNDISALQALPDDEQPLRAKAVEDAVFSFLRQLRLRHPHAYLLWVYGMCGQDWISCFENGVARAQAAGDNQTSFLPLPPCEKEHIGSRFHPGPRSHEQAAHLIAQHLSRRLPTLR